MSAVFLIVQGQGALPREINAWVEKAARYLPFVPETSQRFQSVSDRTRGWLWSTAAESARGGYFHRKGNTVVAYHGYVREPTLVPLNETIAQGLSTRIHKLGFDRATRWLEGDYCLAFLDEDETVHVTTDFIGGAHVTSATCGSWSVTSNRALLVAALINQGTLPTPNPLAFAFYHYQSSASLGEKTVWDGVDLLPPTQTLTLKNGRRQTHVKSLPPQDGPLPWQAAIEGFAARCHQVNRLPDVTFDLTLTGGKDSRAVLSGLLLANALDKVERAYLYADPNHPDVIVGQYLAEHYGIPFEVMRPGPPEGTDWMKTFSDHNFHTECGLNAWDRKGFDPKTRRGDLRGYYGEIYKNHDVRILSLNWSIISILFKSRTFIDPAKVLTPAARAAVKAELIQWIDKVRAQGAKPSSVRNLLHKDCRMHRWVGPAQAYDATGAVAINPIPSERLYLSYLASERSDQQSYRFYFELIKAADDWLWQQPFEGFTWPKAVQPAGAQKVPPVRGDILNTDWRLEEWTTHQAAMCDYVLNPTNSGTFFDVMSRRGLEKLLKRTMHKPTLDRIKAVNGAIGIRQALTERLTPAPIRLPSRRV